MCQFNTQQKEYPQYAGNTSSSGPGWGGDSGHDGGHGSDGDGNWDGR